MDGLPSAVQMWSESSKKAGVLVLSLQWLKALLWLRCDPWPGSLHVLQVQPKKIKNKIEAKKKKKNTILKP